ncbi:MAG: hypothetical protein C5B56_09445 [Proteobacteria bacterium]|nr:MAG: hypothetical protein C5B56_09445 [Pseudomonadota bacterium]
MPPSMCHPLHPTPGRFIRKSSQRRSSVDAPGPKGDLLAPRRVVSRQWIIALTVALAAFLAGIGFILWRTRHMDDYTRHWIVQELSSRYDARVQLARVHVTLLPEVTVIGEDLSVANQRVPTAPPLIHVDRFIFHLGLLQALNVPHRIKSVKVESMTITIPPKRDGETGKDRKGSLDRRSERKHRDAKDAPLPEPEAEATSQGEAHPSNLPYLVVDEIVCTNADLVILPKQAKKEPLDWAIHNLVLRSASPQQPFQFAGTLTNAKPVGEIATEGQFGPWVLGEPGETPVSGSYHFTHADLGPFPGIAGILSSDGTYKGPLNRLEVHGETDSPDFSLDKVGRTVPLHTEYSATVDGTSGDTYLHPVRATLGKSLLIAEGEIVRDAAKKGHLILLNVRGPNARIEDLLKLATKTEKPLMTGPASITAKLMLPPGKAKVIERMVLDGQVGVEDAHWTSPEVREKLEALSRHAEGKPADEDAGSSISNLRGNFHLKDGTIRFSALTFAVPGATIDLAGQYGMQEGQLDFRGHLRMEAKLSQTVTGKKSFFLKAFDPFFKKNGAGAELPISITGTRDNPTFAVLGFHKTIKTGQSDKKPEALAEKKD